MKEKLRIGVVGLGKQSIGDHIPAIQESNCAQLAAVCDIDNGLADSIAKQFSVPSFASAKDMVQANKLDAIIVAVPHNAYGEILRTAAENGVHVIKEKPFAMNIEEGREFVRLAKKHNIHIMVTAQRRFNPIYATFFQLIDKIGRPSFFEGRYTIFTNNPNDGWRGCRAQAGGGCLIDMGYHIIDLIIWYFGLPDKVFAEISSTAKEDVDYDAEDTAAMIMRYNKQNLWGNIFISRVVPPKKEHIRIVGSRGILEVHRGLIQRFTSDGNLVERLSRENSWPSAFTDQIEYFAHVLRGERENIGSPEYHLQHMALLEAAYKSCELGKYVNPHDFLK